MLGSSILNITSKIFNNSFIYLTPPIQGKNIDKIFANSIKISSSSSLFIQFFINGNNSFLVVS